jgi:centriolar protein POC1
MEAAGEDPCIIRSLRGHKESICALSFHPGCRYVASAGMDNLVMLWDLYGQVPVHKFAGHKVTLQLTVE